MILILIKKTIAIFLIVLLGVNTSGISFFYCMELISCKIKAKEDDNLRIEKKRAVIFSSRKGDFKLIGDDELMAEGKMYDIVTKRTVDGVTLYYAANDYGEDEILNKLSISNTNNIADKSLASARLKVYNIIYCLVKESKHPNRGDSPISPLMPVLTPAFYWAYFQAIVSPPPEYSPS